MFVGQRYSDIYPGSVCYYNDQKKTALFESDFCVSCAS